MAVVNHLRQIREAKKLSQGQLAEALKVSRQTINAIETKKYNPSLELALKISKFFKMPVEKIFHLS